MTRTAYARGADFERRVRARLEEWGYIVFRSAGSKSPVDLVAKIPLSPGEPFLFIQVDGSQRGKGAAERKALAELAVSCGAQAVLVKRGLVFHLVGADGALSPYSTELKEAA